MRPLIGITTDVQKAAFGAWEEESALVPTDYTRAVEVAGGRPLLIPPSGDGLEETLDVLDGVVFSGGSDVGPDTYGHDPHPETKGVIEERDQFELALLHAALERDMPVLAVCRGSQILNVALGGDLVQHLPDGTHQNPPARFVRHEVRVRSDSRAGEALGASAKVSCYHHQAVGRLGDGLRATAWAGDDVVEAVELPGRRFAVGVQWHPENDLDDLRVFRALADAAKESATTARSRR